MTSLIDVTSKNFHWFQDNILETERASFPSPWSLNMFREELNRPISRLWVLLINREFGGYICFWMLGDEIHLMNIAVHPSRRGKGLARYLLTKMIEAGVSKGVKAAWLEVRPSNIAARIVYKKGGFREIARRPRYYRDTNEDAIVMSLSLFQDEAGRQKGG
ncbi:MAG: ribosomal protein S18-alanine N-acetyltransferase [Thermodesulfobacteriota bacterium]|nr:ribosomal protein S18-alanine N-acetyltransferase [Thermodesulfobacteriota bacterium]